MPYDLPQSFDAIEVAPTAGPVSTEERLLRADSELLDVGRSFADVDMETARRVMHYTALAQKHVNTARRILLGQ